MTAQQQSTLTATPRKAARSNTAQRVAVSMPAQATTEFDPFYSEANVKRILKSIEQLNNGNVIIKTMEELEAMAK